MSDIKFQNLTQVRARLNNSEIKTKGFDYTVQDLKRTPKILLSVNHAKTQSTPNKFSLNNLTIFNLIKRLFRKKDVNIATALPAPTESTIFNFPQEETIRDKILPFFNFNPYLKSYIENEANQHNFGSAARTEVIERLMSAGLFFKGNNVGTFGLGFIKDTDGSVLVVETFVLPNAISVMQGKELKEYEGSVPVAVVTLKTRILEQKGEISHKIEAFEIIPGNKKICGMIFAKPTLHNLKRYILGTKAIAINYNTPTTILLDLVTTSKKYDALIAANPQADAKTLDILARRTTGAARTRVTQHPNTEPHTLLYIAQKTSTLATLKAIIIHPKVDEAILIAIIQNTHINKEVLMAALNHPQAKAVILPIFNKIMEQSQITNKLTTNKHNSNNAITATNALSLLNSNKFKLKNYHLSELLTMYKTCKNTLDNKVAHNITRKTINNKKK